MFHSPSYLPHVECLQFLQSEFKAFLLHVCEGKTKMSPLPNSAERRPFYPAEKVPPTRLFQLCHTPSAALSGVTFQRPTRRRACVTAYSVAIVSHAATPSLASTAPASPVWSPPRLCHVFVTSCRTRLPSHDKPQFATAVANPCTRRDQPFRALR